MNLDNEGLLRIDSLDIINEQGNSRQQCDTKSYYSANVDKFFHRVSSYTSIYERNIVFFSGRGAFRTINTRSSAPSLYQQ